MSNGDSSDDNSEDAELEDCIIQLASVGLVVNFDNTHDGGVPLAGNLDVMHTRQSLPMLGPS